MVGSNGRFGSVGGVEGVEEDFGLGEEQGAKVEGAGYEVAFDSEASQNSDSQFLEWGALQDAILGAEIQDPEDGLRGEAVQNLARSLRVSVEDIIDIVNQTDPDLWTQKRLEKMLQIEKQKQRGFNWDFLETAALEKLVGLVGSGRIAKASELLMVAQTANRATRRGINHGGGEVINASATAPQVQINVNQNNGLPGPGSIGKITLSLTQRTVKQLSQGRVIDGESERVLDSADMLGPEDVPMLSRLADDLGK